VAVQIRFVELVYTYFVQGPLKGITRRFINGRMLRRHEVAVQYAEVLNHLKNCQSREGRGFLTLKMRGISEARTFH
jgi:hypothetical protein